MNTIVSPKMSRGQGNELLNALEAAGLDFGLAQNVVESKGNDLATKVVRLIKNGGFEPSTSQTRARATGIPVFGVEEAIKYLGVNTSKQQLAYLADVPFTEKVLLACKDTHVLVVTFPLSICELRGRVEHKLFYSNEDAWYNKQAFAKDKGEIGWHLVRKTPVNHSTSKTWDEQQALLDSNEETPTARVLVYTIIGNFLAEGVRLFENTYVRCSDLDSDGARVCVGRFHSGGLYVIRCWDDDRDSYVGLSGARKQ